MKTGFIGLGNIGKPMARQLLKLGGQVTVYDLDPAPVGELAVLGARVAESAGGIARNSTIIGICVRGDADVDALLYGPAGLLASASRDSIIAIHSTVTRDAMLRWAAAGANHGVHVIDAPITGGAAGAEAGTLTYMVGGAGDIIERCRPVFATSGQRIIHAGPVGNGIALKLCNNLMTYAAFAAIHEATALAGAGNLDPQLLIEVGRSNGVITAQMEAFFTNRTKLAGAGEEGLRRALGPFAALGKKDLAAALASAAALDLRLPVTEQVAAAMDDTFLGRVDSPRDWKSKQ